MSRYHRNCVALTALSIVLLALAFAATSAQAAPLKDDLPPQGTEDCLQCHARPGMQTSLPSGETLYLTVDRDLYQASVHGQRGYTCVQCHTDITGFPHPPLTAETVREFAMQRYVSSCAGCHQDKYNETLDGIHGLALEAGMTEAAICTDCHGSHDITPPDEPRSKIPLTCERCHSQIVDLYRQSVHGEALIGEGNPDVPSCIDCHSVHRVEGPSFGSFHLSSPRICASCHADSDLMDRYGISTLVFDTYVADFHGTTVVLFEALAPDQETNKPVCIDCHGVHNMLHPDDPESTVIKENLLRTCQRCHPDATANFPDSWLGHYQPSTEHAPLVYYVNLFYKIMTPGIIGGMLLFVLGDSARHILDRVRKQGDE
ncbi:MAG: cytochrome c3 family protein [Anaerolineales bacterium]